MNKIKFFIFALLALPLLASADILMDFGGNFTSKDWKLVSNGEPDKVAMTHDNSDVFAGKPSLKVTVKERMKHYFAVTAGRTVTAETGTPKFISIAYKGDKNANLTIRWHYKENGKDKVKYEVFDLAKTVAWKQYEFKLSPPANVNHLQPEIRGSAAGEYRFADFKVIILKESGDAAKGISVMDFDGGFENPVDHGWKLVSNGEPAKVAMANDTKEFFAGKSSLKVTVKERMKHYFAVTAGRTVNDETGTPEFISIAYKGQNDANVIIRWHYKENGKDKVKYSGFNLKKGTAWKKYDFKLDPPANLNHIAVEIRGTAAGEYQFDEFKLFVKKKSELKENTRSAVRKNYKAAILIMVMTKKDGDPIVINKSLLPGKELKKELDDMGFAITCAKFSDKFDPDFLKKFNMVVIGLDGDFGQTPMPPAERQKLHQMLWDYTRSGGGLLVLRAPGWCFDRDLDILNEILAPAGAKILGEQVQDDANKVKAPGDVDMYWTNNFVKHAITENVGGFFYPGLFSSYPSYTDMSVTMKLTDPAWQVIMRGTKSAISLAREKRQPIQPQTRGTYQSAPPILAAREFGKGRIVLFTAMPTIFWQDGGHIFWGGEKILAGEYEGRRSDHLQLVKNIVSYLYEPGKNFLGGFQPKPENPAVEIGFGGYNWKVDAHRGDYMPHTFDGLIGARSNLSGGKASPQELIDAAKKADYQFIAFLEPMEKMTEAKFNELKSICQKASDDKFYAYPGLLYRDLSGNLWGAFSDTMFWPSKTWLTPGKPGIFSSINASTRGWGWPPVIMIAPGKNPEAPFLQGNFKLIAVKTYRNNQLIDDGREIQRKLVQDRFSVYPAAVNLIDDPAAIARSKKVHFNRVGWFDSNIIPAYSGTHCVHKGKYYWSRPLSVTSGPMIHDYRIMNFGTTDLAVPGNDRWRMHIKVSSPAGLKEIRIFTADGKTFRRFLPNGAKIFDQQIDNWHSSNRSFFVEVTDNAGNSAFSTPNGTSIQENTYPRCADNLNTMPRGKWWGSPENLQNVRGFENYFASRDFTYCYPYFDGLGAEGVRGANNFHHLWSSRFATKMVLRRYLYYPDAKKYNPDATDNSSCAIENKFFKADVTHTMYVCRIDKPLITRIDAEIEILQDFNTKWFSLLNHARSKRYGCDKFVYTKTDGTLDIIDLSNLKHFVRKELPVNGYAAIFSDMVGGSTGFIALTDNLQFETRPNKNYARIYAKVNHPDQYRKGEKIKVSFLTVSSELAPADNDLFIRNIVRQFGLDGLPPVYKVIPENGKITETGLVLKIAAENYTFNGKSLKAELPCSLPVAITGLNPNWEAGILYKGKNRLLIPVYHSNEYGQRFIKQTPREYDDELYFFHVTEDGTGICQIDTVLGDHDIFIGNVLVCDVPELMLTAAEYRNNIAEFDAHNPTDRPITATVRPGKGFDLMGNFSRTITVQPGSTLRVKIK